MTQARFFLRSRAVWAPGLETAEAVAAWARAGTGIENSPASPPLDFLPSLFKRRLSQLSRMALEVGHRLSATGRICPCVFASRYGEVNKQYAITSGLLEAGEVSPAVFSLSVFNAPVYLLSIAERNTGPGSALCAGGYGLAAAFLDALGFLRRGGTDGECLVLFADEAVPSAYHPLFAVPPAPYAFGLALSVRPDPGFRPLTLSLAGADEPAAPVHPLELLRWLETGAEGGFVFRAPGTVFTLEAGPPC